MTDEERTTDKRTTETAQEARQGRRGVPILVILVVALVLAVVVWLGVGLYGSRIDEEQPVELPKASDQSLEAPQPPESRSPEARPDASAPSPEASEPPEQESRSPDAQ